mgnify:CR=1 FL=1
MPTFQTRHDVDGQGQFYEVITDANTGQVVGMTNLAGEWRKIQRRRGCRHRVAAFLLIIGALPTAFLILILEVLP